MYKLMFGVIFIFKSVIFNHIIGNKGHGLHAFIAAWLKGKMLFHGVIT